MRIEPNAENRLPETDPVSTLADLSWTHHHCVLRALEPMVLPPFKGSAFRGAFGHHLKRVACTKPTSNCDDCDMAASCVYRYIFETPFTSDHPFLKGITHAPHPFVLRPPDDRDRMVPTGTELPFELILIGRGAEYLPHFVFTFIEMGQYGLGRRGENGLRGRYRLETWGQYDQDGGLIPLYQVSRGELSDPPSPLRCSRLLEGCPVPDRVILNITTPVRIRQQGIYRATFNFSLLFRNLLRRIAILAKIHASIDSNALDFAGLCRRADEIRTVKVDLTWRDIERYSFRQRKRIPMGGLVGRIEFAGNFEMLWPFLILGEYFNVGKNTAFGLGRYMLETTWS
jgi:hypothetical protein